MSGEPSAREVELWLRAARIATAFAPARGVREVLARRLPREGLRYVPPVADSALIGRRPS